MQMIEMVEGGDAAKAFEMTKRPTYERPTPTFERPTQTFERPTSTFERPTSTAGPTHERPRYEERRPPTSFFSSSRPENNNIPLEIITEHAKQELGNPFKDLTASQLPRTAAGQSYSYFNMNVNPKTNFSVVPTATSTTTTTTERQREELSRPDFTEVHRAPFFQGLNLENPFKNEFDADFEMTKHGFPSFASQLDYDYNPYDAAPVRSLPPRQPQPPQPRTTEKTFPIPNLQSFSEEESDMPPPGPSPPSEFMVKIPHPVPQQLTTERTVYRTNYQQSPTFQRAQLPTIQTFAQEVGQHQQQFPRSLSYFEQQDNSRVLPTTALVFANEQVEQNWNNYYYLLLVGLPGFARDFNCQLCLYVSFSMSLYLIVSLLSPLPLPNLTKP
jgi:hypothetical protein